MKYSFERLSSLDFSSLTTPPYPPPGSPLPSVFIIVLHLASSFWTGQPSYQSAPSLNQLMTLPLEIQTVGN